MPGWCWNMELVRDRVLTGQLRAQVGMLLLAGSCGGAMLLPLLATLPCHILWRATPPWLHSCVRHALLHPGGCAGKRMLSVAPAKVWVFL
jgi:hypothetical protein